MKIGEIWKTKNSTINSIKRTMRNGYKVIGWKVKIIKFENDCVYYGFLNSNTSNAALPRFNFVATYEKDYNEDY